MTLYRISFKLGSSLVTPLKGDTIWGHIVWGIANHEGNDNVTQFLKQEAKEPVLVVSSAFPKGMVCQPLPPPTDRNEDPDAGVKKKKKIKYVPAWDYLTETEEIAEDEKNQNPLKSMQVMRNTIDRVTNNVLKEQSPFPTEEIWSAIPDWDLYILSSFSPEYVKDLVEWAFENGYGADASTGKGKIKEISAAVAVKPKKQGKTYMALGPFVDCGNGINDLRADIFVRSGKLGGAFATGRSPYKKPVVLYDDGALFQFNGTIEYTGKLLDKMYGPEEYNELNICQSGFAPVIPIE
jgi:CRISPR-associated protein Csm4